MIKLENYETEDGKFPFIEWVESLKSPRAKADVFYALSKIERGLRMDTKPVGEGVGEIRIFEHGGLRIYFGKDGEKIVILLTGSTKADQSKQIKKAKAYWKDYKAKK